MLQISLKPLLAIKMTNGHVCYELARILGLYRSDTYSYTGVLNLHVLECVESGIIQELSLEGSADLTPNFDRLLRSLASQHCLVRSLVIRHSDWPETRSLAELLAVLNKP